MAVLSVPSWVIPGTYAENLRFLQHQKEVAGVELLFFMYDDEVKAQLDAEWEAILSFRERFVFTAHLPEKPAACHAELVARLAPVVRHFIVHPPPAAEDSAGADDAPAAEAALLNEWAKRYNAVFLAENTFAKKGGASPLEGLLPYLDADAGLCLDTGHLLLEGQNPAACFRARENRVREIHLHSLDRRQAKLDNRLIDHRRLKPDEPWLREFLPLLEGFEGVINLEVFSWEEAAAGIDVLKLRTKLLTER